MADPPFIVSVATVAAFPRNALRMGRRTDPTTGVSYAVNAHGTWWGYPPGRAGSISVVFCVLSL